MSQATQPPLSAPNGSDAEPDGNTITPLPGEPGIPNVAARPALSLSKKGLLAAALFMLSLVAVAAFTIHRYASSGNNPDDDASKRVGDRPAAATTEPRRLDMAVPPAPRIPALQPTSEALAEPIGVRRSGQAAASPGGPKVAAPEDAPVLLVSSRPGAVVASGAQTPSSATSAGAAEGGPPADRLDPNDPIASTTRNLQGYQRQLQGLLDSLTQSTALANGPAADLGASGALLGGSSAGGPPPGAGGLFGGQLQGSATPRVAAAMLGNRSLTLPKGTAFTCALKTKLISAASGLVGCQVQRNVFSDDGRVLLIERGSHLDGEYRIASVRPGTVRIPVLWTRIRTPLGVTVDIDSPGTGRLGESGIDGYVDNRWGERIGAAMLLSLIDDSVKLVIQNQAQEQQADTIVLPSSTANSSKLAEKVLESTINIPPLIYQNQGGIVGIYVARDVDFSGVYELQPTARDEARGVPR
jgi:type IV secretion system protein VirB10